MIESDKKEPSRAEELVREAALLLQGCLCRNPTLTDKVTMMGTMAMANGHVSMALELMESYRRSP